MKEYNFKAIGLNSAVTVEEFLKLNRVSLVIITNVKYGGIKVNGVVSRTIDEVKNGDDVTITLPNDEINAYATPLDYPLEILYDDEYFLAVNKPIGMLTHNSKRSAYFTLENAVYFKYNKEFLFRPINRLDKNTSGVVIIAKDAFSASLLGEIICKGEIEKYYLGIVKGVPKLNSGTINAPIKKLDNDVKRVVSNDGKQAITNYQVIKVLPNGNSLIKFHLITGRTHQIRVHSAYIGNPLYADDLYGEKVKNQTYFLSCHLVEFTHPITNKKITIKAFNDYGEF